MTVCQIIWTLEIHAELRWAKSESSSARKHEWHIFIQIKTSTYMCGNIPPLFAHLEAQDLIATWLLSNHGKDDFNIGTFFAYLKDYGLGAQRTFSLHA